MFPHDKLDWHLSRLEKRLDDAPDDPGIRLEYATACLSRASYHDGGEPWHNEALTQTKRVLQSDPANSAAMVIAGLALIGLGRVDPAARYLDEALKLDPERADVRLALGLLQQASGNPHQAVRELEMACRLAPGSWEAHYHLGQVLAQRAAALGGPQRMLERAQFHTVRALQLQPAPLFASALLYDLSISCLQAGRLADAHKLFSRLMDNEAYRNRAKYYLGLVAYHMGKYKNAVLFMRQHLEQGQASAKVHARIGMAYLQLGEVSKAREACNRALAIDPTHLQARWTLGCALMEEQRYDEAVRIFRDILQDAPDHLQAFTELVRLRRDMGDAAWLQKALRTEVGLYDRLPIRAERPHPGSQKLVEVDPRATTRERVGIVVRHLGAVDRDAVSSILGAMALTTDEGMRFQLWEAALDHMAAGHARQAAQRLKDPGEGFSAAAGRDILAVASHLPEALLTRGLQLQEEDLNRAAVDRHGPARDVSAHRAAVERERQEARAWQALLLLAIATRHTTSGRNLLVRWGSEADQDLADAARAAQVMMGTESAAAQLRERAAARGANRLVDALIEQSTRPQRNPRYRPHPASDDEDVHCATCGRKPAEVDHLLVGQRAAICNLCVAAIAADRRALATDDPSVACHLCSRTNIAARAVHVYQAVPVCSDCVEDSLGLVEREEIDRYLQTW